jgi:long-chain acyl-CoA synthetase
MLTHRNLTVNAAQIAAVHRLTGDSVTLNQLPTFHPMHLNSAVWAGASQVLCPTMDPVVGIEAAAAAGAHRYFALPVHLAKLAADERLAGLRLPTVQAIMSGGSALPVPAADRLSSHFGIPVIQGYGLAETSPLTHCDLIDRPEPASVGYPVDGTECRVVDLATGAVLGAGERGEVQVRGPQLMKGNLGGVPSGIDADGWFRTGDVGVCDADGRLYLVDRIKDVFKCDNWLVSPAEIEQVVRRHPLVSDCAVVDRPEKFSGAVAYGFVVPAQPLADAGLAELTAELNRDLPYYQRLCRIEAVAALPRSPNGKIERRLLRDRAGAASW